MFVSKKTITALFLLNLSFLVAGQGQQFITGPCTSDADCASGCCGFNSGKCAGPVVAQERDGGCGFGDPQPNDRAAQAFRSGQAAPPPAAASAPASASNTSPAAPATGTQFITGACTSDADCASGCCGFKSGKCAGPVVAQERDGGCGFGDPEPNDNAAQAFRNGQSPAAAPPAPPAASSPPANTGGGANEALAGNGAGKQFITGACTGDADCASGCCGFKSGKCAGAIVAQERDGGCGFGDAQPNDNAAQKLRGKRYVAKELLYGH